MEEMHRMREHVLNQMDTNKDKMISMEEFLADSEAQASTPSPEGWKALDETKIYSEEELQVFEEQLAKENNWGPDAYKIESTIAPPTTTPLTIVHGSQQQQQQHIPEQNHKIDPVMGI